MTRGERLGCRLIVAAEVLAYASGVLVVLGFFGVPYVTRFVGLCDSFCVVAVLFASVFGYRRVLSRGVRGWLPPAPPQEGPSSTLEEDD